MHKYVFLLLFFLPVSGWGQAFYLGYQGQIDDQLLGVNAGYYFQNNIGVGIGMRTSDENRRDHDDYFDNISTEMAEDWGDPLQQTSYSWDSYMGYFIVGASERLYGYVGAGVSEFYEYHQYDDPSNILAPDGLYWVEVGDKQREFNFEIGLQAVVMNYMSMSVGYQTKPEGVTLGAGVMLNFADMFRR